MKHSTTTISSVIGLAALFGTTHRKMRTLVGALARAGLIVCVASPRGTTFQLTEQGEKTLGFSADNIREFADILSIVRRPYGLATLHIIKQLNNNRHEEGKVHLS